MIRTCASYSDDQLRQLLQGNDDGPSASADHLAECSNCQARLEQLAADAEQWSEIRDSLQLERDFEPGFESPLENARLRSPQKERDHWLRHATWTESMANSLLSPASHPEMLGRIGRYDVERLIGSGGMGVVFKAYDTELNRPVAIKLLAPYLAGSGSARNRFAREARAAAAVVDDHVVPIHNVETGNEQGNGQPFLVMKFIAGGSLQQRIDREGPLEVCEVLRISMQAAKGLAAAHAQGLIHRDVKPSNILLDEGVDRALITDFGLARTTDDANLTRSGFHPGTPHYMSPEQVRGEAIDARSDLFGLGCVMYAMCTGHPPFRSETSYAVLRRITDDTPRSICETNALIPEWIERIVMKLLAKSREARYSSAFEVYTLLEKCLAHVQQPTIVPLPVELQQKPQRGLWLPALAIVSIGIALACAVWWNQPQPAGNADKAAVVPTETVSTESVLQWESDRQEMESLRRDFVPVETKSTKLWDIEPSSN
jgi:serine/threonine protein kinase